MNDRRYSPSAGRNKTVVAQTLAGLLPAGAHVLEIGSGTGEHGAALADLRADVVWQYSDPDVSDHPSQIAWGRPDWPAPLTLDLTREDWTEGLPRYDAIYSANMIHIAPIEAALGLASGAATLTDRVILYGPFLFGEDSAPSNLNFNRSLAVRNPRWGVREWESVKHIFAQAGFSGVERFAMPANNVVGVFAKL